MKEFMIKTFHKKSAIKVVLINREKKIVVRYLIPDAEGNFTLNEQTFKIDNNPYYDTKGFPTYIFKYNNTGPINANPDIDGIEQSHMTSAEYNTAIHNKLARELFNAADNGLDTGNVSMILSFVAIAATIAVGYFLFTEISALQELLNDVYGSVN